MARTHQPSAWMMAGLSLLAGCQSPAPADLTPTPPECPSSLHDQVHLSASASAIALPAGLSLPPGSDQTQDRVARRLLIAASPAHSAVGRAVTGSTLSVTIFGGTFAGTARTVHGPDTPAPHPPETPAVREAAPGRALEVIPGRLRVTPFLPSTRLQAQTLDIDVTLLPGGVPVHTFITSPPSLWTPDHEPVAPSVLQMTVGTEQHLSVLKGVEAVVQLELQGGRSRSAWRCTYETHLTLLDPEAVRPTLWNLQLASPGQRPRWLALFEPSTGPFRAVFADAAQAQAFLTWLHATAATHAGRYQLGLFEADREATDYVIPADRDIARTFKAASDTELQRLVLRRLGEN